MTKKNTTSDYTSGTQVQDNTIAIKLMQQTLDYMSRGIDEIKNGIEHLRDEFKEGYVSKEELTILRTEIDSLRKKIKRFDNLTNYGLKTIIGFIIIGLLTLLVNSGIKQ